MFTLALSLWPFILGLGTPSAKESRPDAILIDTSCYSMGSVVGKSDQPTTKESSKSMFFCSKMKNGFTCQMISLSGDKYSGTGKSKLVSFLTVDETGDTLQLMMEGSLVSIYIDRNAQAYALGQLYWQAASGLLLQKQCVGIYAAGSRVDDVLNSLSKSAEK